MPENSPSASQLTPGLIYELLPKLIHKFTFNDASRQTVDVFCEKAHSIDLEAHESSSHACFLYIVNLAGPSPYLIRKVVQLAYSTPEGLTESQAIVGNSFILTVARNVIFRQTPMKTAQAAAFFNTEEEALAWLLRRRKELG